jgi:hypothetical protein
MSIDHDKLSELAKTLTDDQRRLLREGLAGGDEPDPESLAESLRSVDTRAVLERLAVDSAAADVEPLVFAEARGTTSAPVHNEPVIVRVDRPSMTLADVQRLVRADSGRGVSSASEVRVLDLDPSEVNDTTLKQLATRELTEHSASAHRLVRIENPSMSASLGDIEGIQQGSTGSARTASRVVVVIVFGPVIIIIVFTPPPSPPPEPPLTRW